MRNRPGIAVLAALAAAGSLSVPRATGAQDRVEDDGRAFTLLPIVAYAPETGVVLAGYGLYYFRMPGSRLESRASHVSVAAGYTTRNQYGVELRPDLYFDDERWIATADLTLRDLPTELFGVGNDTRLRDRERYELGLAGVATELSRRVLPHFYVGLRQDAEHADVSAVEPDGMLAAQRVPGAAGGWISGVGLVVRYDDRDKILDARAGGLYELAVTRYDDVLGSDHQFTRVDVDLRKFHTVLDRSGVAVQLLLQLTSGDPPFTAMPELGGPNLLRGIYGGRYRDANLVALQTEYRFPLAGPLGGAVFAGAGSVASAPAGLAGARPHGAAGAGLRVLLDRAERVRLRLDGALSQDDFGFYLTVGEAF